MTGGGRPGGGRSGDAARADLPARLLARVREFSFPRFPGGDGERRAAAMMTEELEAAGWTVREEPFVAGLHALDRLRAIVQLGLAVGMAAVARVLTMDPALAWPGALALLAAASTAGRWRVSIERWFDREPTVESANVCATRAPRESGSVHLVFLAHRDTKSTWLPTFWPAAAGLAALVWLALAAGWSGAAALGDGAVPLPVAALGYALAAALAVLTWNPMGDESPGAMDNASGLAVLGELARTLPADPALAAVRLTVLVTGAEELGLAGAARWIAAHERELEPGLTCFVNVDSVGVGRGLLALDVNGTGPDGRPMAGHVRDAARDAGVRLRFVPFLPGVGVDTMPIAARGHATVSLLGEVLGSASRRIHSRFDTVDPLDGEGLAAAVRTAHALARRLAGPLSVVPEPAPLRAARAVPRGAA